MWYLLIKLFLRQRVTLLSFALLLTLGIASLFVGRQLLNRERENRENVTEMQRRHIEAQIAYHPDDLGLILYYLKFAYVNPPAPLAGLAIGQTDLNNNIQHVTILALEGQKYDTDLVNPMKLQVGNLDLSFVLIFLFPLVVIALSFNLWYEEVERGTWRILKIQGKSTWRFLLSKLVIRIALVLLTLLVLYALAIPILGLALDEALLSMVVMSVLYVLFWFMLSLLVVSMRKTSSSNAIVLLSLWLVLVILLPVGINNYVSSKYPIDEALTLSIKQRDEYHKRWDTDKQETMRKFVACYPEMKRYTVPDSGFTWGWYYAMQHMGDLESGKEKQAMLAKVRQRIELSNSIARWLPPVKMQLVMNELAGTDLGSYLRFLDATSTFHETKRLAFYPAIFEGLPASDIHWEKHNRPMYHKASSDYELRPSFLILLAICCLLGGVALYRLRSF